MRFIERMLLLLYLIGIYFVFQKPPDPVIAFIAAGAMAIFFTIFLPFLIKKGSANAIVIKWHHFAWGSLLGLIIGYTAYSIIYLILGKMDIVSLLVNNGLLYVLLSIWAILCRKQLFYQIGLKRLVIYFVISTVIVVLAFSM